MNLYSQKVDGSVAPVETEKPVAKEPKRKTTTKKAKKEVAPPPAEDQVVPAVEPEQTYEDLVQELEAMSDAAVTESVAETEPTPEPEPVVESMEVKKPKRKPKVPKAVAPTAPPPTPEPDVIDDEPPKWFMNYVSNMKTFQNEVAEKKKPKRVLKNESDDYAKQQWKKPDLRQRVTDSVDSHLTRMYRQIFSNRA